MKWIPLGCMPRGWPRSGHARYPQGLDGDGSGIPDSDHTMSYATQGTRVVSGDTSRVATRSFITVSLVAMPPALDAAHLKGVVPGHPASAENPP